jgi:hypothetical protein
MSAKRQKKQYSLALEPRGPGETPVSGCQGTEPVVAKPAPQSPALTEQLMEQRDSNCEPLSCEPLSDAFVNFSPFEGRGDANADRPERADTLRSTGTTTDSYALECGRRLYGSLAPGAAVP